MTITIPGKALVMVLAVIAAILAVAAISYATETVTGNREYISCFQRATETQLYAYEKYISESAQFASAAAQHQADFVILERQYIKDVRNCG